MKKICLFAAFAIAAVSLGAVSEPDASSALYVEYYAEGEQSVAGCESVRCGNYTIVTATGQVATAAERALNGILSKVLVYDLPLERVAAMYNVRVLWAENTDGLTLFGYCPSIGVEPIEIRGKQVNVQISESGDVVKAGFPVIYGSW